jgi:predicted membrane-bound spermidine synthase
MCCNCLTKYSAAHAAGAIGVEATTLTTAVIGATTIQFLTFATDTLTMATGAVAGAAIGLLIGLEITRALGGDRVAILGGFTAGFASALILPTMPFGFHCIILITGLVAGVLADQRVKASEK